MDLGKLKAVIMGVAGEHGDTPQLPAGVEEFETALEVQFVVPELGLAYADDSEANRYIIDRNTDSDEKALDAGQRIQALVTSEGHVQRVLELMD